MDTWRGTCSSDAVNHALTGSSASVAGQDRAGAGFGVGGGPGSGRTLRCRRRAVRRRVSAPLVAPAR